MSFLLLLISTLNGIGVPGRRFQAEARGEGERVGVGAGVRNDPNNVCTCEQMNNNTHAQEINASQLPV
jgi:hypothetical protein